MSEVARSIETFVARAVGGDPVLRAIGAIGANSRLYEVNAPGHGDGFVLKHYAEQRLADDPQRLAREVAFYRLTADRNVSNTPQVVAADESLQVVLLTRLMGTVPEASVASAWWRSAVEFVERIQVTPRDGRYGYLGPAADSCQFLRSHLDTTELRVRRTGAYVLPEVEVMHRTKLIPMWREARRVVEQRLFNTGWPGPLPQVVSPGDLGMHNSIVERDGRVCFLDFEYAGWDDPAKVLCDVELRPSSECPRSDWDLLAGIFAAATNDDALLQRVALVRPLHAVKWASIALNPFVGARVQDRSFVAGVVPSAPPLERERLDACDRLLLIAGRALEELEAWVS